MGLRSCGARALSARSNNFDGLRLIAALMVLVSHEFALSGRPEPSYAAHSLGIFGVLIFFSISGYLISASWFSDPNLTRFIARRALRLVPGVAAAAAAMWIITGALGIHGFPKNPNHLFNPSLWTIPYEAVCYVLLMLLCMASTDRLYIPIAGLMLAACGEPFLGYFGLYFLAGVALNRLSGAQAVFAATAMAYLAETICPYGSSAELACTIPAAAILIGTRSWPLIRSAGRFGDLSYGVYIYGWPVQQIVIHYLGAGAGYFELLLVSAAFTIALALLSWHFIEHPALRMKPALRRSWRHLSQEVRLKP